MWPLSVSALALQPDIKEHDVLEAAADVQVIYT
jgi:hypothetical protein